MEVVAALGGQGALGRADMGALHTPGGENWGERLKSQEGAPRTRATCVMPRGGQSGPRVQASSPHRPPESPFPYLYPFPSNFKHTQGRWHQPGSGCRSPALHPSTWPSTLGAQEVTGNFYHCPRVLPPWSRGLGKGSITSDGLQAGGRVPAQTPGQSSGFQHQLCRRWLGGLRSLRSFPHPAAEGPGCARAFPKTGNA